MTQQREVILDVWPIQNGNLPASENFPEQRLGFVEVTEKSVGIAASGGGSRSHVFCAGYFRGLRELGVLDKITYISSVSGGSWASSILTYADMNFDELLGHSQPPEECTIEYLDNNNPGRLADAVGKFLRSLSSLVSAPFREKTRNWWARYIGTSLLMEFGLKEKVFTFCKTHAEMVENMNEDCEFFSGAQLVYPPIDKERPGSKRPFLIMNGVVEGPKGYTSGWGSSLQLTPLYSGVPFYANNGYSYHRPISSRIGSMLSAAQEMIFGGLYEELSHALKSDLASMSTDVEQSTAADVDSSIVKLITGGGVISTHAFGVQSYDEQFYRGGKRIVGNIGKDNPFYLEDAVGISSAAFVAAFENYGFSRTAPRLPYLPVLSDQKKFSKMNDEAFSYRSFGDGGNFENTGILPLVQRGVRRVIAFINTADPLLSGEPFVNGKYKYNGQYCMDSQFLCLFGQSEFLSYAGNYTLNQIFQKEDLDSIISEMIENRDVRKKGAVVKRRLATVRNEYWNICEGEYIDILFIYNERCGEFIEKLPTETQQAMGIGLPWWSSPFEWFRSLSDFPHFGTVLGSFGRVFSLNSRQINIATAHGEYLLSAANKDLVQSMFE